LRLAHRGWSKVAKVGVVASSLLLVLAPQVLFGYGQDNGVAYPLSDGALHGHRIAVVKPIFTATAYSSFYNFYAANQDCLLYTSPSPRDLSTSRMPSSA